MNQIEDIELRLFLQGVLEVWGYDFRHYAPASLKRRIHEALHLEGVQAISDLQKKVLHNKADMKRFLNVMTVSITSMFRDPAFYLSFRKGVVNWLATYPFVRIWVVGCATGEEAYSLSILLQEEGLIDRVKIYATDMNEDVLKKAREGIYPLSKMKDYTANYQKAGGVCDFSDYYTARYDSAIFNKSLQKQVVWAHHNLVTDASFNEFQVILCRNVMIYFDKQLQDRVHELLYESLCPLGVLVLGAKESLRFTPHEGCYEVLDEKWRMYRRVG